VLRVIFSGFSCQNRATKTSSRNGKIYNRFNKESMYCCFLVFSHLVPIIISVARFNKKANIQSVQDVTGVEFKLFMDFLRSLSIFGDSAPRESFQELIEIIQAQADLDAQFDVSMLFQQYWSKICYTSTLKYQKVSVSVTEKTLGNWLCSDPAFIQQLHFVYLQTSLYL
jgi:hypothetical protein